MADFVSSGMRRSEFCLGTDASSTPMQVVHLVPLLDEIRSKIEVAQFVALPASALSKACQYALTLWRKLTRFLEYPELELSTNLAENSMRPVALGRKNWLHIGSLQAGPKVAAILSVVQSCRRLRISVRDYLASGAPRPRRCHYPAPPRTRPRCLGQAAH